MLELRGISKRFPGVRALNQVSVSFQAGEIHGLMGENGAGKSTAIKLMTGLHQPDEGAVFYDGRRIVLKDYRDSLSQGIGMVHQELTVIPDASVAENIMIDKLRTNRLGLVDWRTTVKEARSHMEKVGLDVDPDCLVRGLSAAQKQLIQIAKALSADVRVLLLDEPTSCLTEHETARLFTLLKRLRDRGVILIFVSHKIDEVFEICDRVSVLRDGSLVGTEPIAGLTHARLVRMMIGRQSNDDRVGELAPDWGTVVLEARGLERAGRAEHIDFKLHRGEILGFYGLVGSGRTELARLLIGEDQLDSGEILLGGEPVRVRNVGDSLYRLRMGYVSENRKEEGLFLEDPILNNLTLTAWPRIRNALTRCISGVEEHRLGAHYAESLSIKTPSLSQSVKFLSGGNQQKVSIGKWLVADCDILIIDEPTIGVDVGAKDQIHRLIWELAARQGKSLIVISSDLPELVRLVNRLLVFRDKRIVGEVRDIDTAGKSYARVSEEITPYFA